MKTQPTIDGSYKGVLMQVVQGESQKFLKGCGTLWGIHPDYEAGATVGTYVTILNDKPPFRV